MKTPKTKRKTLRKLAYQYEEVCDLYKSEKAKALKHKIYADLKLKFLDWLETTCAGNYKTEWNTENFSPKDHWLSYAWQEAIIMFAEDLQTEDFIVDIIGNTHNYTIKVALYTVSEDDRKRSKDIMKEFMDERIPYEIKTETDDLFRGLFSLHDKDNNFDHPKYKKFEEIVKKHYRKNMTSEKLKNILIKGNKSTNYKSPLNEIL
tara:strand:+ start:87 stop:701 length:615 start_codon:yes stop_codon:yes gene_type:complete